MKSLRIGIVAAAYHPEITDEMVKIAEARAKEQGCSTVVLRVGGCFDIPWGVQKLLPRREIDGVVTLGALVKGKTDHDVLIANAAAWAILDLQMKIGKPVALGITGPNQTYKQAVERIPRAADVVDACILSLRGAAKT